MRDDTLLLSFSSWEDRFRLGFSKELETPHVAKALVLSFSDQIDRTQANRAVAATVCKQHDVTYDELNLDGIDEAARNWQSIWEKVDDLIDDCLRVTVDISCMPREIAWYTFWMLEDKNVEVRYIYFSPERYSDGWLSREPLTPRLVYKLSGVARPSARTALVVTAGFDLQRIKRIVNWCEPSRLMVGVQRLSRFARNQSVMEESRTVLSKEYDCEFFELDAYSADRGSGAIRGALDRIGSSYNVLMASLGPKLTAVSLYRIQRARAEHGLVYAPANQYSPDYSTGLGQRFEGSLFE
jgi:hypothetical protein